MRSLLPFEPPNHNPCMALYHPEHNAWWLVMGTYNDAGLPPWKSAIQSSRGTLRDHWDASRSVGSDWRHLRDKTRTLEKEGYVRVCGSLLELSCSGTRWLKTDPKLWWRMHSANMEQLQIIRALDEGSSMVLQTLASHGFFGAKENSPGRRGPSVVEHRWKKVFPKEMAFAQQCQSLGLNFKDAQALWCNVQQHSEALNIMDLGDLLDIR